MQYTETAEELREVGKHYLFDFPGDEQKKDEGIELIIEACKQGDPEAMYISLRFMLDGAIEINNDAENDVEDIEETALSYMCLLADEGYIEARAFLNAYCNERYEHTFEDVKNPHARKGMLVDFDGKPIKISRKGVFTPVDAVLSNENGKNVLTLSANIFFFMDEFFENREKYRKAVLDGIKLWQGEYEVFGGQELEVRINLTTEHQLLDSVFIMAVNEDVYSGFKNATELWGNTGKGERLQNIIDSKRSFAMRGLKWSTKSRKLICIQSEDGKFDDYEEIKHVAKHEFGHALGLGDLYYSPVDSLDGVETGSYKELDSFLIADKLYNLVMCDHHGPVSNNDIEMVVLAFSEDEMQNYQAHYRQKKISRALGNGN